MIPARKRVQKWRQLRTGVLLGRVDDDDRSLRYEDSLELARHLTAGLLWQLMKQKHTGGGGDKAVPEREGLGIFNGDFSDHTGFRQRLFGVGHGAGREVETAEASLGSRHRQLSQKTARVAGRPIQDSSATLVAFSEDRMKECTVEARIKTRCRCCAIGGVVISFDVKNGPLSWKSVPEAKRDDIRVRGLEQGGCSARCVRGRHPVATGMALALSAHRLSSRP